MKSVISFINWSSCHTLKIKHDASNSATCDKGLDIKSVVWQTVFMWILQHSASCGPSITVRDCEEHMLNKWFTPLFSCQSDMSHGPCPLVIYSNYTALYTSSKLTWCKITSSMEKREPEKWECDKTRIRRSDKTPSRKRRGSEQIDHAHKIDVPGQSVYSCMRIYIRLLQIWIRKTGEKFLRKLCNGMADWHYMESLKTVLKGLLFRRFSIVHTACTLVYTRTYSLSLFDTTGSSVI